MRPRTKRGLALVAIVAVGLVWRKADLGLPFFAWKYGGSALWGAMVLTLVGVVAPSASLSARVLTAGAIAIAVEFSRLYHTPALDDFRLTLAGALLLGRLFSIWNIVAYFIGIGATALVESIAAQKAAPGN